LLLIADAHAGDQLRGNLRGKWRLKTGRIRILYRILEDGGLVIVDGIVYRDQAYPPRGH
jgi:mRNA-degrading endonuclease RelE of RelBE toxin-antitoxin system